MSRAEERNAFVLVEVRARTPLQMLQRRWSDPTPTATPHADDITGNRRSRIRCPRCAWQPRQHDRWSCLCDHVWNTFDTGGVCPACRKVWEQTQCLRCHEFSPHEAWYVWDAEDHGKTRRENPQ